MAASSSFRAAQVSSPESFQIAQDEHLSRTGWQAGDRRVDGLDDFKARQRLLGRQLLGPRHLHIFVESQLRTERAAAPHKGP
jgi:hypothetical protein